MKFFIYFAIIFLAFFLGCTDQTTITAPATMGTIKGRIVDSDSAGLPRQAIIALGTNVIAISDTDGSYAMYNVPPGNYRMLWADSLFASISVTAGETTFVPAFFVYGYSPVYYDSSRVAFTAISLLDPHDSLLYILSLGDIYSVGHPNDSMIALLTADSVKLAFQLSNLRGPTTLPVVITHNGDTLYKSTPPKGRLKTEPAALSGADTFKIHLQGSRIATLTVSADPASNSDNFVHVFLGQSYLSTVSAMSTYFVEISSVKYWIVDVNQDVCDWDLYFINDSTGDTCYWANPFPDWGAKNVTDDDPYFRGDVVYSDLTQPYYSPDQMRCADLSDGAYSMYVRFFDGPVDSVTATPLLNIKTGASINIPMLQNFVQKSPARPMHKGETWFAGTLRMPQKTYTPSDSIIAPAMPAIPKQRL